MDGEPHLTPARFIALVGEEEARAIAGVGGWNVPGGRVVDDAKIADAVAHADRLVEGYVRGRYPAGVSSPILTQAAADIARYRLRSTENAATVSEDVRRRHDDAMKLLKDVQGGRQALTGEDGLVLGTADGPGGTVMTSFTGNRPDLAERSHAVLWGYR